MAVSSGTAHVPGLLSQQKSPGTREAEQPSDPLSSAHGQPLGAPGSVGLSPGRLQSEEHAGSGGLSQWVDGDVSPFGVETQESRKNQCCSPGSPHHISFHENRQAELGNPEAGRLWVSAGSSQGLLPEAITVWLTFGLKIARVGMRNNGRKPHSGAGGAMGLSPDGTVWYCLLGLSGSVRTLQSQVEKASSLVSLHRLERGGGLSSVWMLCVGRHDGVTHTCAQ